MLLVSCLSMCALSVVESAPTYILSFLCHFVLIHVNGASYTIYHFVFSALIVD